MTYWRDSLLIGVPKIDEQHRKLVKAVEELMDACSEGKGRATIGKTLEFVISYTKEHFADEEKLQAQYAYPGIIAHKQLHKQLLTQVTVLKKEFEQDGPNIALIGKINKTLVEWLIYHITIEDKKIGEFIQNKGRGK